MDTDRWRYAAIVILILLSAFFSGSETAFASANRVRLKKRAQGGGTSVRNALYICENYEKALSAILIGNNLVNISASSLATLIALGIAVPRASLWATLILTLAVLVFGEIVPKIAAKQACDRFSVAAAVPMRAVMTLTWPVVYIITLVTDRISGLWKAEEGPTVTEEELMTIIETVEDEGLIDEDRSDLLISALEFEEITAQEILIPRVDMVAVDVEDSLEDILSTAQAAEFSRLPVYENSVDNIIGILYLKHLYRKLAFDGRCDIRSILMEPCFVHRTMKLPAVLAQLKKHRLHIAVVNDEYGGTLGLLTMEDVLEQLVGEIWDETDEIVESFRDLGDGLFEADGDMSIYELFEEIGRDPDDFEGEFTTAGGWAIDELGRFPEVGESFEYKGLTATVTGIDGHRVTRLQVRVPPEEEEEE